MSSRFHYFKQQKTLLFNPRQAAGLEHSSKHQPPYTENIVVIIAC